jgi:phospholipid transport system substrate-binding protein
VGIVIVGLLCGQSRADDLGDAARVVRETSEAVTACMGNAALSDGEKREQIMEIVTPVFDFALMGKLALGRRNWPRLNEQQRKRYTDLFVGQLRHSYADKILLFSIDDVAYDPPVRSKSKIHVGTTVTSKGEKAPIRYKLYKHGNTWKAYDVEIDGVSIVSSYRAQYAQVLETGSVEDLLRKMAEKAGDDEGS